MRLLPALAIACWFFFLPGFVYGETGTLRERNSENIEKADRLGEDFQNQGPWSRQRSRESDLYGIPQPRDYQGTPDSQLPEDASRYDITQYPLCYNPYAGAYEYCYPDELSYSRSKFRSPFFRPEWRRQGTCPRGYYFVPEKGCYRN